MTESLPVIENVKRLEFSGLRVGDIVTIKTGQDDDAWRYSFETEEMEGWPTGKIAATTPAAESIAPTPFELHGCGRWTTPKQNPVQKQMGLAFTPYYDGLIVGSFLWGKFPGQPDRAIFDKPGQEISEIQHAPYRHNAISRTLATQSGPLTVRQIIETIASTEPYNLSTPEIRSTLRELIATKRVALLKGRVQLFSSVA